RPAVERQLDGGKAGCFLSGGTDSSSVAGMIGAVRGAPAATYSIGFEAQGYDEMAYARIAARHFGTEHHEYYVTPADLARSIPRVATHYDQPFGNSSALPAYYCARMAGEDGLTRMLAGDGGDELFGGNSRYAKSRLFDWYRHVPGLLRAGLMEPLLCTGWASRLPILKKGASYVEQARVPMPRRLEMYNLIMRLGPGETLTPELLREADTGSPLSTRQTVWDQAVTDSALNRELAYDWRYTLAESDLPKIVGTTSLAGVEVGFPMLDDDLLDFSLRLPADYKLKGLKLRWFFKDALRGFLPDEILSKKKQGFGLPFGLWVTRDDALRALAAESVRALAGRGILRADFVERLFDRHLHEHPGYFGEMIWISMMLEQWLRGHAPDFSLKAGRGTVSEDRKQRTEDRSVCGAPRRGGDAKPDDGFFCPLSSEAGDGFRG
ncbi:MAG: asparagine synthase C-terminal domain-containing protein, partial [Candidatus Accumulibacter sp.]|nr:asparagine synthase C-terminal domain-containing protein [Accumulibacter sp.]